MPVSAPGRNDWGPVGGRHVPGSASRELGRGPEAPSGVPQPRDPRPYNARSQPADGQQSPLVRPYAVTGGRTKPRYQLQIEAMVAASHYEARDLSALSPECQAILGFCRDWRSVAEISAVLRMPLGVARVLVADMAVEGLVRIHQTDHEHGRPNLNLLERVLSGLRKL
ncbi:MAG: DUF742 domain-containing protein [Streptosporangiaceae bacterium]